MNPTWNLSVKQDETGQICTDTNTSNNNQQTNGPRSASLRPAFTFYDARIRQMESNKAFVSTCSTYCWNFIQLFHFYFQFSSACSKVSPSSEQTDQGDFVGCCCFPLKKKKSLETSKKFEVRSSTELIRTWRSKITDHTHDFTCPACFKP